MIDSLNQGVTEGKTEMYRVLMSKTLSCFAHAATIVDNKLVIADHGQSKNNSGQKGIRAE